MLLMHEWCSNAAAGNDEMHMRMENSFLCKRQVNLLNNFITLQESVEGKQAGLSYVSVQVVDANNIPVLFASNMINFEVTGAGKPLAVGNGNQQSHTPLKGNMMEVWQGKCLAIIQSTSKKGEIKIIARSGSLPVATVTVKAE